MPKADRQTDRKQQLGETPRSIQVPVPQTNSTVGFLMRLSGPQREQFLFLQVSGKGGFFMESGCLWFLVGQHRRERGSFPARSEDKGWQGGRSHPAVAHPLYGWGMSHPIAL